MIKFFIIFNSVFLIVNLLLAACSYGSDYGTSSWLWMLYIFAIFVLSGSLTYAWLFRKAIDWSERNYQTMYLDLLEQQGQQNGNEVRDRERVKK